MRSSGAGENDSEGGSGAARPVWAGDEVCELGKLLGKFDGVSKRDDDALATGAFVGVDG